MVIFFLVRAFFCDGAFSDGDDVKGEEEQERFLLLLLVPRGGGRGEGEGGRRVKGKRDDDDDDDDAVLPSNSMRGALARLFLHRESKRVVFFGRSKNTHANQKLFSSFFLRAQQTRARSTTTTTLLFSQRNLRI
jgi:hypothetical protein